MRQTTMNSTANMSEERPMSRIKASARKAVIEAAVAVEEGRSALAHARTSLAHGRVAAASAGAKVKAMAHEAADKVTGKAKQRRKKKVLAVAGVAAAALTAGVVIARSRRKH